MSCPTCGHTMHRLDVDIEKTFWCPRCGTLLSQDYSDTPGSRRVDVPKLVERVKALRETTTREFGFTDRDQHTWHRLGIDESIIPPEERKT